MTITWTTVRPSGLTYTDIFCGAGGSSIGLVAAGLELRLAANHWARAIETHAANFRDADHLCADVNNYDMRRLPRTDILWASPICTEISPAGGNAAKRTGGQLDLLAEGPIDQDGFERTRATFHDVIRATEVHRYRAVLVENVVDVAWKWELFDWWCDGMRQLGYVMQTVSVSAAHVGGPTNAHAPQWRDRLYLVFTRVGAPRPDVEPRPLAWCSVCEVDIDAVQSWRNERRRKIGKYRQQYDYRCPNSACRHVIVEPYVAPASAAIDWSDLGTRVGDRKRKLARKTIARIEAGLAMFAQPITLEAAGNTFERRPGVRTHPAYAAPITTLTTDATKGLACPPVLLATNHDGDGRAYPADSGPLPTRTIKIGEGIAHLPFVSVHRGGAGDIRVRSVDDPLTTVTASGNHLSLTVPPFTVPSGGTWREGPASVAVPMGARTTRDTDALVSLPFIAELRGGGSVARSINHPLATITAGGNHHGLVIPFRRGAKPYPATTGPLSTVATREQHGLTHLGVDVDDCLFRMLSPREHLRAQRFPDVYIVTGNKGEQTMQAGNAVAANVAQWLGERVAISLGCAGVAV